MLTLLLPQLGTTRAGAEPRVPKQLGWKAPREYLDR